MRPSRDLSNEQSFLIPSRIKDQFAEENNLLMTLILECQNQGKFKEGAVYTSQLQMNNIFLSKVADMLQKPQPYQLPEPQPQPESQPQATSQQQQHPILQFSIPTTTLSMSNHSQPAISPQLHHVLSEFPVLTISTIPNHLSQQQPHHFPQFPISTISSMPNHPQNATSQQQ